MMIAKYLIFALILNTAVNAATYSFHAKPDNKHGRGWANIHGALVCHDRHWQPENVQLALVDRGWLWNNEVTEGHLNLPCQERCSFSISGSNGIYGISPQLIITHHCNSQKVKTTRIDVNAGNVVFDRDIILDH